MASRGAFLFSVSGCDIGYLKEDKWFSVGATMVNCFTCNSREAEGFSAYCRYCQPRGSGVSLKGNQSCCGTCLRVFSTLGDFDRHQEREGGVFTGRCFDPGSVGLELSGCCWGTPEGNANRRVKAGRLTALREAVQ